MSALTWGDVTSRLYTAGVDKGVVYLPNRPGVSWSGLVSITEDEEDSEVLTGYYDGEKYHNSRLPGSFAASVEAYTYPQELDGAREIGLSYRTRVGDDQVGLDRGYQLHLVYNATLKPGSKGYETLAASPASTLLSWDLTTRPRQFTGSVSGAHLVIDTTYLARPVIDALEAVLYGTDTVVPRLPYPVEILDIFEEHAVLRIIDNGDGTWTAIGPDEAIRMLDPTTFEITWPSAIYIDYESYEIYSR